MQYTKQAVIEKIEKILLELEALAQEADARQEKKWRERYGYPDRLRVAVDVANTKFNEALENDECFILQQLAEDLKQGVSRYVFSQKPFQPTDGIQHRNAIKRGRELLELLKMSEGDRISSTELEKLGGYAVLKIR